MPLALVTGGAVRLGRAISLELARAGFDLIVCVHDSMAPALELAQEVERLGRRMAVEQSDLSDAAQVEELAARVRKSHAALDVLVHNAGVFEQAAFQDVSHAQYRRMQAINVEAPYFLTQALLPLLRAAQKPVVVQIVDNAHERPMNKYTHYMVSKAGAAMLVKALAVELGPHVRVCGVAPGAVAFPEWWTAAQKDEVLRRVPLKREGSPEDIARAVRFMVEHEYLSGVILPVDGGRQAVF